MPHQNEQSSLRGVEVRKAAPQRKQVTISRADLDWASSQGLVGTDQVGKLWQALVERSTASSSGSKLDLVNLAYYGGATIVLIAMVLFMGLSATNASSLMATSIAYSMAFIGLGHHLYFRKGLEVPGGLMFTLAVAMTPVFIFATMNLNGTASANTSQLLILEFATVAASVVALTFVRFPFLTMPLFTALWLMSVTITSMVVTPGSGFFWGNEQLIVSMSFGAIMTAGSIIVDRRTEKDFAFWGYLFGVSSFWLALTFLDKGGHLGMFGYFCANVVLLLASVVLQRRIFLATGGLGAAGYILYEATTFVKDPMGYAILLTVLGVGIILAAIQYHKNKAAIDGAILGMLPEGLRTLANRQD
jgi:hypothetical protein